MSNFSKSFVAKAQVAKLWYKHDSFSEIFEHILIQTNNICTRQCKACYYWMKDPEYIPEKLSDEAVYNILNQLSEIDYSGRIGLFDINEPLTDQRIFSFVSYAAKKIKKAWKMIITNGDLLDRSMLKKLIDAWIDQISVSIYDDETYLKMLELKDSTNVLERIHFELMDFRNEIFTDNRGGNIDHIKYNDLYVSSSCERIYKIIVVKSSWNVVSCFGDFFQKNVMGSIYESKLVDIWFWDRFHELRKNLDAWKRWRYNLCRRCNYPGSWGFFKKPQVSLKK